MTRINAYLSFAGNCREAMTFYQECFGGELEFNTYENSPMAQQMPPAAHQKIMHSQLFHEKIALMAADVMPDREVIVSGNSVSLMVECDSEAEINRFYANLAAGGEMLMPLADQFWGARFGMVTDKFGFRWMLNFDKSKMS